MANDEHLKVLKQGVVAWNAWRRENHIEFPDLTKANLSELDLREANFKRVNFTAANLMRANLSHSNFHEADLTGANLRATLLHQSVFTFSILDHAQLSGAFLYKANLQNSWLRCARLEACNLSGAILGETNFSGTILDETIFNAVDLSNTKKLNGCIHAGPSSIDYRTIAVSKNVPLAFWRGCGLPDALIEYMPSLSIDAINFYSCFISYSSKDEEFADRLHADLQNKGVRCWFAPHDLPIGVKILDGLDEAIRLKDKVVLILSEGAIASDWVEDEVTTAFEEERRRKQTILFPIRLDNAVMKTDEAWASKLRARNIGDFTKWKEHDVYMAAFERILRDLRAKR